MGSSWQLYVIKNTFRDLGARRGAKASTNYHVMPHELTMNYILVSLAWLLIIFEIIFL